MAISQVKGNTVGQVGVKPRRYTVACNNTYAQVTSPNFLQTILTSTDPIYPTDVIEMLYGENESTYGVFRPSMDGNQITLVPVKLNGSVAWAGGSTSHAFTIPGLSDAYDIIPAIKDQAGTAYIVKWAVTANTLTVTFSANPGVMELGYQATLVS